jgi:phosphate transport system substrate-binding protein
VKEGVCNIGTCSRPLKKDERDLTATVIARDGIAIIVHPTNPVTDVTVEQICALFSGKVRNWREIGGPDMPVRIITREDGSGTRGAFQELIMEKTEIADDALVQDSNGAVREVVAGDPNIVGYISLGLVDKRVKALKVQGISPTEQSIAEGRYKFVRPFLFLTRGPATGEAAQFIAFVLSAEGQKLLQREGLVSARSGV